MQRWYPGTLEDQENALISYMEEHSAFAASKFLGRNGVEQKACQWNRLCAVLNELGPPKNKETWIRYWTTLKSKARSYNAEKNAALRETGNNTDARFEIKPKFERIINILGTQHKNGLSLIPEVGIKTNLKRKVASSSAIEVIRNVESPRQQIINLLNEISQDLKKLTQ